MSLAKTIDHTVLKADATSVDIQRLCAEAREYNFYSVCVNGYWVATAVAALESSNVKVCAVIGFPLGAASTRSKVFEATVAIEDGAHELDMVINVGAAKEANWGVVLEDVSAVARVCAKQKVLLKVILETALLTDEEITRACQVCVEAKADFVKTSTGFSSAGATVAHVKLMKLAITGSSLKIKASGGIHTTAQAQALIDAGASRLGTSRSISIVKSCVL